MTSNTLAASYQRKVEAGEIRVDAEQLRAIDALQAVADNLRRWRGPGAHPVRRVLGLGARARVAPRGLYLHGEAGRGKSMLMDLFFASADVPSKRRIHFHAFMQEVHAGIRDARARDVTDPVAPVARSIAEGAGLLCFDEMQITDITDAMLVGRLFQRLFALGVVVVTTSNRPPDDLYKDGWNRDQVLPFIALIKERMEVFELRSPTDHRRDRALRGETYITPLGPAAARAIDAVWHDLTAGAPETPLRLTVQGRAQVYGRSVGRTLRCAFGDLCDRPLGAADYLALAGAVDVLVIENVPRLDPRRSDVAWRFVTLVDALYEARVRLILSADVNVDDLYPEGEGAFEFSRTASRLQEMRSIGWWAA